MKNFLAIMLMLFAFSSFLFSAEPIIKVGDKPSRVKLEYYEDSEELFTAKLLEYYEIASILKAQILFLGSEVKTNLTVPSYEELSDQDVVSIIKYYRIAKKLENEVKALPEDFSRQQIQNLEKVVTEVQKKNAKLSLDGLSEKLENSKLKYFQEKINQCVEDNINKNFELDSLKYDNLKKMEALRQKIRKYYEKYYETSLPIISASVSGETFSFNSNEIQDNISLSTELIFNLNPIFKWGKYFDFWGMYHFPVIYSNVGLDYNNPYFTNQRWNSNIWALGLSANVPTLFDFGGLNIGFKLGGGHYFGNSNMYNVQNTYSEISSFNGQLVKLELNFGKQNVYYPFEVFIAYTSFFQSNNLKFYSQRKVFDLGQPTFYSLSLGLRIALIRSSILK